MLPGSLKHWATGCAASTGALAVVTLIWAPWSPSEESHGVSLNRATLMEHGAIQSPDAWSTELNASPAASPGADTENRTNRGTTTDRFPDNHLTPETPALLAPFHDQDTMPPWDAVTPAGTEPMHPWMAAVTKDPIAQPQDESLPDWLEADEQSIAPADPRAQWQREEIRVRSGDTFARIMSRAGYGTRAVHDLVSAGEESRRLRHLRPGHRIVIYRDEDGELAGLDFPFDADEMLRIERIAATEPDSGFTAEIVPRNLQRHLVRAEGEITHSMYRAARQAGLNDRLIMQLSSVFGWEVDLGRDLRRGHRFRVLYEEIDGGDDEPIIGDIVAAKLMMGERVVEAVRFTDGDGRTDYYSPDGTSLRREFKRHPIEYRRISSPFDRNRRHPVLGVRRPHLGVDYAAPTGTPIRAAGEGRVVRRGWHGGYGRTVEIEHGSRYRTLYAHMSRFADDVRQGDRVERGQVLGYVGRSGMATGPHLHYEFIVNGTHRDPLEVDLPKADPLAEQHRDSFDQRADRLLTTLRSDDAPQRLAFGRTNETTP